jgi:hypothetical protein
LADENTVFELLVALVAGLFGCQLIFFFSCSLVRVRLVSSYLESEMGD